MRNISTRYRNVKVFLSLACLLAPFGATAAEPAAETAEARPSPQFWISSGFLTRHFKRDAGYNERNTGLGVELRLNKSNAIVAGVYDNSVRQNTRYLQYVWTPLHLGPVRFGATGGLIDGYPLLRDGKVALTVMPVATADFKVLGHDAGLNFIYIPTIAQRVDGALALQLKVRVY